MCLGQAQTCLLQTLLFLLIFGRAELIISVSRAKFDVQADGEVYLNVNPQELDEKRKQLFVEQKNANFLFASKQKCGESSETSFDKISRRAADGANFEE